MNPLEDLLARNRAWAESVTEKDPTFFDVLAAQQSPEFFWIGCSDSRVPANQIVGLMPGEVFVHRNVANMVIHTDANCLTALQYAVEALKVRHVMVVGHYGCGGVKAASESTNNGWLDNWLRNIKDVQHEHQAELDAIDDAQARVDRLCELNVKTQVAHVAQTNVMQNAWHRGQEVFVHGWIYSLKDGLLKDLDCSIDGLEGVDPAYRVGPPTS